MKLEKITKEEAEKIVNKGKGKFLNYGYAKHYFFLSKKKELYINRGDYYEKHNTTHR